MPHLLSAVFLFRGGMLAWPGVRASSLCQGASHAHPTSLAPPDRRVQALVVLGLVPGIGRAADLAEAAAVRRLLDIQVEAWNRKDLDAFLEGYWHSPNVVFQSGADRSDGFEALRDRYRKKYQTEGAARWDSLRSRASR